MIHTTKETLKNLLISLGVKKGDVVMIHSAIYSLGLIEGGVGGFYETIMDILGDEGTLVVPTFTYSFRRNEIYDVRSTPSAKNIGIFSEFVRKLNGAQRSLDPLFSMCAIGPRASELMQRKSNECFGENSIYGELFNQKTKFIGLGITYSTGLTGFVHIERIAKVPYRESMRFDGRTCDIDGCLSEDFAIHYSRNEREYGDVITDREAIGHELENRGVSKAVEYGYGRHVLIQAEGWLTYVLDKLEKEPLCMLDKN